MVNSSNEVKRFNLTLPDGLYNEVFRAASERGKTMVEMLRDIVRAGMLVLKIHESPGKALIIREGDSERHVEFIEFMK